jgi:putative PIN family toxin of toxin-antitoxin system
VIYAVIDTNVIVSAMMARRSDSATVKVLNAIRFGRITTVYTPEIVEEYREVLSRGKFRFAPEDVQLTIDAIISNALLLKPHPS